MSKPSFEISANTRKLVDYLQGRESASYTEMNRRTGRQIDGPHRYVLTSALRVLQREYQLVFVTERGVGIKRATNGQVATLATDHIHRKTHRAVRRGKKLEPLVNTQELNGDERDAFFIGRVVSQMLDATIGRKMRSRIANEIQERGGEQIDVTDLVALFQKRAH